LSTSTSPKLKFILQHHYEITLKPTQFDTEGLGVKTLSVWSDL